MNATQPDQAIVIGAGIAGLLAARALADHFGRVLVIERDVFPAAAEPRKGTPQAFHIHNLLRRGLLLLEDDFPGLTAELLQAGALQINWTADLLLVGRAGAAPRFPSDLLGLTMSRSLVEFALHRRVAALPAVTFLPGAEVVGLLADDHQSRITGVRLRYRDPSLRRQPESLPASLVVDASGRSSRLVDWLNLLGYAVPPPTKLQSFTTYATREYTAPPDFDGAWKVLLVRDQPPYGTQSGGIYPIEGGRWLVTVTGAGKEAPPTDEAGFEAFASRLHYPGLWQALAHARPLSKIHGFARTDNHWQHFESMPRFPAGLVALGDAACTFNPVYGQGMTVAALEAAALKRWLSNGGGNFQRQVARLVRTPWLIATNADLKLPETLGSRPNRLERIFQGFVERIELLAYSDPAVYYTYLSVTHLLKPPAALFAPAILLKALGQPRRA